MTRRMAPWLEHPRALHLVVGLTAVLALPTLAVGFYSDDDGHLAVLEGNLRTMRASPLDLYRFVGDAPGELHAMMTRGPFPWWSAPGLKLHFFRPLASALIALSHALWGRLAPLHHLVSIVCYLGLVLAVAAFHRRAVPRTRAVAMLATLLFALDGHHAQPLAWIACRHVVVSAVPAVLGLTAHLRAVHSGWRPGRWLGPLGLAVGLLGGESALGVLVFWLAHDGLAPGLDRRTRLRASLPVLTLATAYTVGYKVAGYGAAGSEGYLDPATEPGAYLIGLGTRLPALLADAFGRIPSDASLVLPPVWFQGLGGGLTAWMGLFYMAVRPVVPAEERAALRWLLPGALGGMAIGASGVVGSRVLLVPCVGGSVLIAVLLWRGVERVVSLASPLRRMLLRAGLASLVLVHLVVAPLTLVAGGLAVRDFSERIRAAARMAEIEGPHGRHIVVLAASDPGAAIYGALTRAHELTAADATWHVISMARHTHRVQRVGAETLRVDIVGGRMLDGVFETLFRSPRWPFHAGDRVELTGSVITVVAVDRGAPTALEVRLDRPLDDPGVVVVAWREGRLGRIPPLKMGEVLEIPWSPGPMQWF